jgi:cytochrome P450
LSYNVVHSVFRDSRFRTPPGPGLEAQGITSGLLWDANSRNIVSPDGAEHHRLRKLVSKAFTPRGAERLRAGVVDIITELVDPLTCSGRCDVVTDIAVRSPIPVICAALGVPRPAHSRRIELCCSSTRCS